MSQPMFSRLLMNRWLVLAGLVVLAFGMGYLRATTSGSPPVGKGDTWEPSVAPVDQQDQEAMLVMAASGRWQVIIDDAAPDGPSGEFSEDYRLVAVIRQ